MTLPAISALCVTYARPEWMLAECIECFLRQDYRGPKELVVLNTAPFQELVFDHPEVKIINLKQRPESLGEARNLCVLKSTGHVLVTWDSDDLYLPNHLSNFGDHWREGEHWLRLARSFFCETGRITKIIDGTTNVVAFTRQAWKTTGGYARTSCGEDTQYFGKLSAAMPGRNLGLALRDISFLYCWGQGTSHISGYGADAAGKTPKYEEVLRWTADQVAARRLPVGRIEVKPRLRQDYPALAREFVRDLRELESHKVGEVGLVLLGRYGDVLNILPVARHIAQVYERPRFFIAREFADVLDGVSYVRPEVLDLPYDRVNEALHIAHQQCQWVLNAQVYGREFYTDVSEGSYNSASWKNTGLLDKFYDPEWRLVMDRRDPARERVLAEEAAFDAWAEQPAGTPAKPLVLLNVDCGASSPFPAAKQFVAALTAERDGRGCVLVNTCQIKAHRLYDLLGLLDRARLLITADTALLHLAGASGVPVVALVNDNDWLGSIPRCRCVLRFRYRDALANVGRINQVIGECVA